MATVNLTEDDEGKKVLTSDGDEIGTIAEVRDGRAYVDPDPGTFDSIKSKLNWGDADEDTYPLEAGNITEVTDDAVRLERL